jgi:broad specificity phosphatase PhoE
MGSTEILLLRHGQSEGNESGRFGGHGPTKLTALGRRQAEATARALAKEGLTAIYTSDLPRAVETADPVVHATGIIAKQTAALRERSVGVLTGLSFAEAELQHPEAFAALMRRDGQARPPEGETHGECIARAAPVIDEIVEKFPHGRTLIVSHALAIYLLLMHVLGADPKRVFIRTDNCGLHRLKRTDEGFWTVLALNDRAHLVEMTRAPIDEV